MKIVSALLLSACAAIASGCAGRDEGAVRLDHMVGQSEVLVRKVMGVPERVTTVEGRTYLAYIERNPDSFAGYDMLGGYGRWGTLGYRRIGFEAKPELYERSCETTIAIQGGRMEGYTRRGNACS